MLREQPLPVLGRRDHAVRRAGATGEDAVAGSVRHRVAVVHNWKEEIRRICFINRHTIAAKMVLHFNLNGLMFFIYFGHYGL